ncbi:MAG TPA: beta-N-acetylhexosaminidase [Vitreimonas sp.]|uniref:beta-N-acetylhexosaminidase n=1 Tax=Vitreimonas sp. TaxID=3069702 RepID=UPI002D33DB6A|nr:beta-N-acetylhexosaminidase [Vitreimonas sp.]HYD86829.1 beta-N-acetylhexosaminidase [Vitreimonas sp.]
MSLLSSAFGVRQAKLDADTRAFFREARPWSFILFREACVSRVQVRALCDQLRDAAGHDAIVWIDQEGGRVARLKAPEWPVWPPAAKYGQIYKRDFEAGLEASRLGHRLIAHELKSIGVDADYAPVLDVPVEGSDKIVGDRAFSAEPGEVAMLARAALEGLHEGGVAGSIKHMPGHGRATADSHFQLPRVTASQAELENDIAPFAALADAEAAMTAHIVFDAWDADRPATCSPIVIENIIRGRLGFSGLLMSDDLDMKALQYALNGGLRERAEAALGAGCDVVLQCSGDLKEMQETAKGCRSLQGLSLVRARAVEAFAKRPPREFDAEAGWVRFKQLVNSVAD